MSLTGRSGTTFFKPSPVFYERGFPRRYSKHLAYKGGLLAELMLTYVPKKAFHGPYVIS